MFFGHFWAYVGQPHDHIGWAPTMPFASINPTNPRTDPWNFHKKILRIDRVEKWTFFESAILNFILKKKKKILAPWKLVTNYVLEWMGLNFQYYDGLQPKIRAGIINEHECMMWPNSVLEQIWLKGSYQDQRLSQHESLYQSILGRCANWSCNWK